MNSVEHTIDSFHINHLIVINLIVHKILSLKNHQLLIDLFHDLININNFWRIKHVFSYAYLLSLKGVYCLELFKILNSKLLLKMGKKATVKRVLDVNQAEGVAGLDQDVLLSEAQIPSGLTLSKVFPQISNPVANQVLAFDGVSWVNSDNDNTGGVPLTRTVNGKPLSTDIVLNSADTSSVPLTRTVNSKALSTDIVLNSTDIGSVPLTRTVNLKPLNTDIVLNSADTGSVPLTRTINGLALSGNITLTAADVSALSTLSVNQANGVAGLDSGSKLSAGVLPDLSLATSLTDVELSNPVTNNILGYDGNKWVNTNASSIGGNGTVLFSSFEVSPTFVCGVSADYKKLYVISDLTSSLFNPSISYFARPWTAFDFNDGVFREPTTSTITSMKRTDAQIYVLFNTGRLWAVSNSVNNQGSLNTTGIGPSYMSNIVNIWVCTLNNHNIPHHIFINNNNTSIQCKGTNAFGQLGIGNTTNQTSFATLNTTTFAPNNILNIWPIMFSTSGFTVIQTTDYRIWFTGANFNGVFGNSSSTNTSSFVDVTSFWGNLFLPIQSFLGSVTSSSAFCVIHRKNGTQDVLHMSGILNSSSPLAPVNVSLSFLQPGESISQLTFSGNATTNPRVYLLTSNKNLYIYGMNILGTATSTSFTSASTDIDRVLIPLGVDSINVSYNNNRFIPTLVMRNGVFCGAGGVIMGNTPSAYHIPGLIQSPGSGTSTFVNCAINYCGSSSTIVETRFINRFLSGVNDPNHMMIFALDSSGYLYLTFCHASYGGTITAPAIPFILTGLSFPPNTVDSGNSFGSNLSNFQYVPVNPRIF